MLQKDDYVRCMCVNEYVYWLLLLRQLLPLYFVVYFIIFERLLLSWVTAMH